MSNFYIWLLYTYGTFMVFTFFQFCLGDISITSHNIDGEEEEIPTILYGILVGLFSVAWPVLYIFLYKSRRDE